MTDPVQLLQQVAAQLQREGKTPSLALFRARLAGRIAPQQLFAAYQQWRNNPILDDTAPSQEPAPVLATTECSDNTLAQTLARIEAKLDLLLSKLDK
ncbi:hypothetical protein SAMN05660691_03261 [Rheinheimera pacifica]|uniref:KfrA N-terminal DNA-binding domain-containing protein n=1 Tax=Rheinheimera pacifica TaxID=173990 RepID=A0A1H6N2P6_9GAMM|nr:hypothetical protein [Rheinheimera pacifica]SEI06523.1 hypothetical protein SAMN05660691_03261 [Rheinheimera pacifica]